MENKRKVDVIAVGEILLDLISSEYAENFASATNYVRIPGGSPANLAMNMARLGKKIKLTATVGPDDSGDLLIKTVEQAGVDISAMRRALLPTSLILVTKSKAVSNFEPYRLADAQITAQQLKAANFSEARVLHTTAFALSHEPARSAILSAFKRGAAAGAKVSVDFNYADKIWGGDRQAGLSCLRQLCEMGAFVKVSEVDFERLLGKPVTSPQAATEEILKLGAQLVCLTVGPHGCYVQTEHEFFHLPANEVTVVDTTGAGDAFWSGFLAGYLSDYDWKECAIIGRALAELKLTRLGPVLDPPTVAELLNH